MKRIVFLLTGLLASSQILHAQNNEATKYECIYEYKVNNGNPGEVYSTILMLNDTAAMFSDYSAYLVDSVLLVGGTDEENEHYQKQMVRNEYFFDQTVWQNNPDGKYTVCGTITPERYYYTEDANTIVWTMAEGTDTICGYSCGKATGEYGGRLWTVWYTSQIPVVYGPWKLCGLPGLVMKAKDTEGIHSFEAIAFRRGNIDIQAPNTKNHIKTTREKFVKTKNIFEKNPMGNIPVESIGHVRIDKHGGGKGSIFIDGQQLRIHPNGYIPLELQ